MESAEGQANLSRIKPDFREMGTTQFAPFLGGIFSAGGSFTLRVENGIKRSRSKSTGEVRSYLFTRVIPLITYSDNRGSKIERFENIFGGKTISHASKDSYRWYLKDHEAVKLAFLMKDFLPSRSQAIEAFQKWSETKDPTIRLAIAQQLRESTKGKPANLPKERYRDLIEDPQFLAGVFESRGLIYHRKGEHTGNHIAINSENEGLLEAIREKYGGAIEHRTEIARILILARKNSEEVIRLITPHLVSPLSEYEKKE